ncbi:MAG: porin [Hylemonella sp.]|nr:porin [Hylemonella sp.]
MKKTLIAVAALAATTAFAQNVTITGTLDATYRSSKTSTAAGTDVNTSRLGKDGIGTTGFTLSGNEDLGGGLKAVFLVENNFDVSNTGTEGTTSATGTNNSTGQVFVGVEGSFGSLKLGAANSPTLTIQGGRAGSFGTKDGGRAALGANGYTTLMGLSVTRNDASFVYASPNFSGFSIGLAYAPKSDDGTTPGAGALSDVGLNYANGPIAAGVSVFNQEIGVGTGTNVPAVATKSALTSYFVTYDFKFAKFGLGGHTYKGSNAASVDTVDNAGMNVLAEVPVTPALALTVNYQRLDDKLTANADSTQTAVGAQYSLSKRSMAYARYINQTADNAAGATVEKANRFLVGLRHNF